MLKKQKKYHNFLIRKSVFIFISLLFISIFSSNIFAIEPSNNHLFPQGEKWYGTTEFTGKLGNHRDLTEASFLLPITQDQDSLMYFTLRGQTDEFDNSEGNFGIGYRQISPAHKWIYGGYGYFDVLKTENDNMFKQLTFGAELLSVDWDFRMNDYLAEDKEEIIGGNLLPI